MIEDVVSIADRSFGVSKELRQYWIPIHSSAKNKNNNDSSWKERDISIDRL